MSVVSEMEKKKGRESFSCDSYPVVPRYMPCIELYRIDLPVSAGGLKYPPRIVPGLL